MKNLFRFAFVALAMAIVISACETRTEKTYQGEWLEGEPNEIIAEIENQFAGFSQTMWETAYRYQELYWAGVDANWEYADYQLEHILEALEQGFVRRPDREASSSQFVNQSSPALLETIEACDREAFLDQFNVFTATCNTCHAMEDVAFITIVVPEVRTSTVKF
jgi:hypothetical protein